MPGRAAAAAACAANTLLRPLRGLWRAAGGEPGRAQHRRECRQVLQRCHSRPYGAAPRTCGPHAPRVRCLQVGTRCSSKPPCCGSRLGSCTTSTNRCRAVLAMPFATYHAIRHMARALLAPTAAPSPALRALPPQIVLEMAEMRELDTARAVLRQTPAMASMRKEAPDRHAPPALLRPQLPCAGVADTGSLCLSASLCLGHADTCGWSTCCSARTSTPRRRTRAA
jgi:hypothetical protein